MYLLDAPADDNDDEDAEDCDQNESRQLMFPPFGKRGGDGELNKNLFTVSEEEPITPKNE